MTDKESVAARSKEFLQRPRNYAMENIIELVTDMRKLLSEPPLSPAQGDGMRDALADLVDAISHSDFRMTEDFLVQSFRCAQAALASHPDRQPGNTELRGQPDRNPSNGEE